MYDSRQSIHRITVQQNIYFHQVRSAITCQLVVQRSIATGNRLQSVKVIINNLTQRQCIVNHNPGFIQISHVLIFTAFFLAQLHNRTNIIFRYNNGSIYIRLFYMVDNRRVWEIRRIIYHFHVTVSTEYFVNNVRRRSNQAQIIFALQSFLNNVHMQQSQEAAAEAKAQRNGCFRLKYQRSIV